MTTMKPSKWMCAALASVLATHVWGATEAERAEAQAELTADVAAIEAPGGALPGGYILLGDDVFPLAECRNYDGTTAFVAAGAFYGKGRAVMLAHPNFLGNADFQRDTKRLLENAVRWGTKGKATPRIAVLRDQGIANVLKAIGCTDVTVVKDPANLKDFDFLALNGINREEVQQVLDFVKAGGGLAQGALGWGFMYFRPNACFAEDFHDNRLSGTLGAVMGRMGVNRMPAGGFTTVRGKLRKGTTVDEAIALAVAGDLADKEVRQQVSKTLSELMNGLPSGVRADVYAKLSEIARHPEANRQPSPEHPLGAEALFARLAVLSRKNAWQAAPEKVWPADPAAAVYPGLVKPGTPSIVREVPVDLAIPKWHSTGVYAPAGQALTVKIPEAAVKLGLKVRIGTTQDDLSGLTEWKRFPLVTVELPLVKTETVFASPFGGLVYIVVPEGLKASTSVTLAGGVMAPWFKLGRDTNEKFLRECAETGAPWGEIECDDFVVTSETAGLKRVKDPAWVAAFWGKVMKADQDLAQWKVRRHPERICSDVQLITGWLHDGYPLMSHINAEHFDWAIDQECLADGDGWGVYHEIGHMHQNRAWTPDGTGEVTVNLFTMYALETVVGANLRANRYPCGARQTKRRVGSWVKRGKSFDDWKKDYFLALEMYLRIKEAYGWEVYKTAFASYHKPGFKQPTNDAERWNTFARELSTAAKADLGAALTAWSIPLDDATKAFCAKFPAAKESITANLETKSYVPPPVKPVSGEYMAVTLAGPTAGEITMIPTRAEIPGGEQDRRWKTTDLLLRRIEPTELPVTLGNPKAPAGSPDAPHEVEITKPYYIGVYELTQEQYFHLTSKWRENCWGGPGDRETRPVQGVSYDEVRGNTADGIDWPRTGYAVKPDSIAGLLRELTAFRAEFDLPTDAQWEYACRAGTTGDWNNGEVGKEYKDPETKRTRNTAYDKLGRYYGNGGESALQDDPLMKFGIKTPYGTAEVGSYAPNAWGLYDFHGNVYEHCLDYNRSYGEELEAYSGKDPVGPKGPGVNKEGKPNSPRRTMRGGSWWNFRFGSPGAAVSWRRLLGESCGTGTGHGATGLRFAVPAAVAPEPQVGADAEPLTPEAYQIRKSIVAGADVIDSKGLPGPVYCTSTNAIPIVAAKNWDGSPACLVAVATYGRGRVAVMADDEIDRDNTFFRNLETWLTKGEKTFFFFSSLKTFDLSTLPEDPAEGAAKIAKIEREVAEGAGYLFYGRAWPWRQKMMAEKGKCRVSDWPGNQLLAKFGLLVGDFCVRRTAGERGWSVRKLCDQGSTAPATEMFEQQNAHKEPEPTLLARRAPGKDGILVLEGETIAFLGDSITRLGGQKNGYIDLVLKGLEIAGVKNVGKVPAGCDGQNASDMLGRIGGLVGNPDVKFITISCGVNDIWGYDWGRGVQLEDYCRDVRRMYDKAAAAGVQVIALTPTLVREEPDNEYNRLLDPFADFIRAEAKRRGLPLADCRKAEIEALKTFPPDSGKHFTYDGVHPIWEGNKLIAREILKALGVPAKYMAEIEAAWESGHAQQ